MVRTNILIAAGEMDEQDRRDLPSDWFRRFMERFDLKTLDDWYRVRNVHILASDGKPLLDRYGSLIDVLRKNYPTHRWEERKFALEDPYWKSGSKEFVSSIVNTFLYGVFASSPSKFTLMGNETPQQLE